MILLRTERLALRPFTDADAEALLAIHQHEGLRRFVPSAVLNIPEAARAVLAHSLRSRLPRVVAVTDLDNHASQAVCRRIGMTDRGVTGDYYDQQLRLFVADAV